MSTSGQHDTLRRVLTSAAIVGATLIMVDGGRGLTGRAGGGDVGCGGGIEVGRVAPDLDTHEPVGLPEPEALRPYLEPTRRTLSFAAPSREPTPPSLVPTPGPGPAPTPSLGETVPVSPRNPTGPVTVMDGIEASAGRFAGLFRQSELDKVVAGPAHRYLIFAPSDAAVEAFSVEHPELFLAKNATLLTEVLALHVVVDPSLSTTAGAADQVQSLVEGATLEVEIGASGPSKVLDHQARGAQVIPGSDYYAGNGMVYVIDRVLMPRFSAWSHVRNQGFNRFASALVAADRVSWFTDPDRAWTVLAPTDDAFDRAGWTENFIHDPGNAGLVEMMIDAHRIEAPMNTKELMKGASCADGQPVKVSERADGSFAISRGYGKEGTVVETDIVAGATFVHGIDTILIVP